MRCNKRSCSDAFSRCFRQRDFFALLRRLGTDLLLLQSKYTTSTIQERVQITIKPIDTCTLEEHPFMAAHPSAMKARNTPKESEEPCILWLMPLGVLLVAICALVGDFRPWNLLLLGTYLVQAYCFKNHANKFFFYLPEVIAAALLAFLATSYVAVDQFFDGVFSWVLIGLIALTVIASKFKKQQQQQEESLTMGSFEPLLEV